MVFIRSDKELKSVHFKKTVAQSTFLSKVILAEIKMITILKEMRIVQLSFKMNFKRLDSKVEHY